MALTTIDDRGLKTPIDLLDNEKIRFGTGNDLEIYHSGSHSYVTNTTNSLLIESGNTVLRSASQENYIVATLDSDVELYYDGSKKLATTSTGATVTGIFNVTGGELFLGTADTSSGHINAYENMTFNIDTDNDDTNRTFKFLYNGASGSGTTILELNESGNVQIPNDTGKLQLGTSQDLELYHDGSNSWIKEAGTGILFIDTNGGHIRLSSDGNTDTMANFFKDGSVDLYYDNSKKFKTLSGGAQVLSDSFATLEIRATTNDAVIKLTSNDDDDTDWTIHNDYSESNDLDIRFNNVRKMNLDTSGNLFIAGNLDLEDDDKLLLGAGDDLSIYHDGSNSFINHSGTGVLRILGGSVRAYNAAGDELMINATENGDVDLYYDNSLKFSTYSNGLKLNAQNNVWIQDDGKLVIGGGSDLILYHDGTSSYIDNNKNHLFIRNNVNDDDDGNIYIQAKSGENSIICNDDGAVYLYNNDSIKLATNSTGVYVYGGLRLGTNDAANEMDDYEEGIFTITARDATSGGNATTTNANCFYTKVGRLVTVQVRIANIDTTGMTSSNQFYMTGLPFTSADTTGNRSTASCYVVEINPASSGSVKEHLNAILIQNTSYVYFAWSRTEGEGPSTFKVNDIDDDAGIIEFNMTYTAT